MMRPLLTSLALVPALALAAPPPYYSTKLANGLEVLVAENHLQPLVHVEIAFHNGSMTEPREYNGVSHLYEHMFFKQNAATPNQEAFMDRVHSNGMVFNGTTDTERVNYFFTTTTPHFEAALTLLRDAAVTPLFDQKELERERVVVTGEMDIDQSDPGYWLEHLVSVKAWSRYPTYKDPLGDRQTVLSATTDMMKTIQQRYYVPNNAVLVVSGDVTPEQVNPLAQKLFGDWKAGPDPFVEHPLVQHPAIAETSVVLVEKKLSKKEPVDLVAVWHGPSTMSAEVPQTYAADMVGYAIGSGPTKWEKALVESGYCYGASFGWQMQRNVGPVQLSLRARPEAIDLCLEAALDELHKLAKPDYFTDKDLANAMKNVETGAVLVRESPDEYANYLTSMWASAGLDYEASYVAEMKKVDRARMADFMKTYVLGKPFVFGVLVSPELKAEKSHFEKLVAGFVAEGK